MNQIKLDKEVKINCRSRIQTQDQNKSKKHIISANKPLSARQKKAIAAAIRKSAKCRAGAQRQHSRLFHIRKCTRIGICKVKDNYFTKTIQFFDINYQLARNEDKNEIFENYCDFLNYFDQSISVQFSFLNQTVDMAEYEKAVHIPEQADNFNDIRIEYMGMLKNQLSRGNNGIIKRKFITFGIEADNLKAAKQKLERIETDILGNFKALGVQARPLNGLERLELLHCTFNEGEKDKFGFHWDLVHKTGLSSKDFIAPTSFDFRDSRTFGMGGRIGTVSFLQILAPELTDRMLADFLDLDMGIGVNIHIKSIDQSEAIKTVKRKNNRP